MPRVFAKVQGAAIRLGNFGVCTPEVPVEVPDDVAQELLALNPEVRVVVTVAPGVYPTRAALDAALTEAVTPKRRAPKEEKEG